MAQQSIFKSLMFASNFKHIYTTRLPVLHQPVAGIKYQTKQLFDKLNIPERPKKPFTSYFKFCNDYRREITAANSNLSFAEIGKKCGEAWKALDESKKAAYQKLYQQEMENYTRQYLEYESKLTEEQKSALRLAQEEKEVTRKKREINKIFKETNKPKRPLSAYAIFALAESKKINKTPITAAAILKTKWVALPEQEKQKYEKLANDAKKKYEEEMIVWEKRMLEEGKENLLRKKTGIVSQIPSRFGRRPKKHPQKQQDGSGVSEKNFEMCDEKQQKQGLFEKVKRIFKVS